MDANQVIPSTAPPPSGHDFEELHGVGARRVVALDELGMLGAQDLSAAAPPWTPGGGPLGCARQQVSVTKNG